MRRIQLSAAIAITIAACNGSQRDAPKAPSWQPTVLAPDSLEPSVVVAAPRLKTTTRPLPGDIAQLRNTGSVTISPSGDRLVYTLAINKLDPSAKLPEKLADDHLGGWSRERQLWMISTKGGAPVQLTHGQEPVSAPRWSPDGSALGFVRKRGERRAIHVLPMSGGEARVIDTGKLEIADFAFSRDGNGVLVLATPPQTDSERAAEWKDGGAYSYDRNWRSASVYRKAWGKEPVRLATSGHVISFNESPDGKHLALLTSKSSNPYLAFSLQKLVIVNADGSAAFAPSSGPMKEPAATGTIRWSPNGEFLAFERGEKTLSLINTLQVFDLRNKATVDATAGLDPSLDGFVWSRDSRDLIVNLQAKTRSKLIRISRDGKRKRDIAVSSFKLDGLAAPASSGAMFSARVSNPSQPRAPALVDPRTGKVTVLVEPNPEVKANWALGETEVVSWTNKEGTTIEGILTRSSHAKPGVAGPLVVMPHGGPDSVSMEGFDPWAKYFAARGYSVLRPNYRGGFGYGYDFYAANRGRLGDIEFVDIESGVDHLIKTGVADPNRLFFGGWSWGGFITTWTITKTNRYKAAVVGAGVVDTVSQYVTSDINHGVAAEWEFGGLPWRNPESFARSNPALSLGNIKTPTLVIHGKNDTRVAFVNGQTLYRALDDAGTEVTMLAYPREPHGFREPAHVVHMLEAWAHHFDSH